MIGKLVQRLHEAAIELARYQARHWDLPGTSRLLHKLYSSVRPPDDYLELVMPYHGGHIQLDTRSFIEWSIYMYGGFDRSALALLKPLIGTGMVALDVGANVGVYTLAFARWVGSEGAVHSFEPHPRLRERLTGNVALNNLRHVTVVPAAVGPTPGEATLFASTGNNQGTASLRPVLADLSEHFTCPVTTLDAYVKAERIARVDVLKVDVEGADFGVLQGASKTIERDHPVIFVEVAPSRMASFGASPRDLRRLLADAGYLVWTNRASDVDLRYKLEPVPLAIAEDLGDHQNWLAVHPATVNAVSVARMTSLRSGAVGHDS
jgi:FkbM family methyltransferase